MKNYNATAPLAAPGLLLHLHLNTEGESFTKSRILMFNPNKIDHRVTSDSLFCARRCRENWEDNLVAVAFGQVPHCPFLSHFLVSFASTCERLYGALGWLSQMFSLILIHPFLSQPKGIQKQQFLTALCGFKSYITGKLGFFFIWRHIYRSLSCSVQRKLVQACTTTMKITFGLSSSLSFPLPFSFSLSGRRIQKETAHSDCEFRCSWLSPSEGQLNGNYTVSILSILTDSISEYVTCISIVLHLLQYVPGDDKIMTASCTWQTQHFADCGKVVRIVGFSSVIIRLMLMKSLEFACDKTRLKVPPDLLPPWWADDTSRISTFRTWGKDPGPHPQGFLPQFSWALFTGRVLLPPAFSIYSWKLSVSLKLSRSFLWRAQQIFLFDARKKLQALWQSQRPQNTHQMWKWPMNGMTWICWKLSLKKKRVTGGIIQRQNCNLCFRLYSGWALTKSPPENRKLLQSTETKGIKNSMAMLSSFGYDIFINGFPLEKLGEALTSYCPATEWSLTRCVIRKHLSDWINKPFIYHLMCILILPFSFQYAIMLVWYRIMRFPVEDKAPN